MKKVKTRQVWKKYSFRKYSKSYPRWFKQEKNELLKLFRKNKNFQHVKIEHIGSTAVPGLGGKGIIDIAIFTPKLLLELAKQKLLGLGYEQWPVPKKRKFFSFEKYCDSKDHPSKVFHIHLTSDPEVFQTMLLFRDYLRVNPKVSQDYAKLKKKAVKICKNQYKPYLNLKNPFIRSVIRKARKEKTKEIKAIIFDLGNVIVLYNNHKIAQKMSEVLKVPAKKVYKSVFSYPQGNFLKKILKGNRSKDCWDIVRKELNLDNIPKRRLEKIWNESFQANKPIFLLLRKLKKRYKLALISDAAYFHKKYLSKKFSLNTLFPIRTYSCDVKTTKLDSKIFQITLKKIKTSPQETIFIDDYAPNLIKPKKLGIKTILFKNNTQLIKDLKKSGVEVR